ncbi:MAG: excinuclease ABC subunit UvrC [Nitrospirota bacterium]|mgnify:CR=1 FL=1
MDDSSDSLHLQLEHLPHQSGVYLMKNRHGTVLYIGKALRLIDRVRSYFQKGAKHSDKTESMVRQVDSIETIVTGSELEALLLENSLIKKYRPKYNILLRDNKNYPMLRLPILDDYPRLEIVRQLAGVAPHKKDGALYFGPYIPSNGMYEMLRLLRKLFPLPNCTIVIDGKAERPCIEFEMKRCLAPCTGHQSKYDYREMIKRMRLFLEGKDNLLIKILQQEMAQKAAALQFEEAGVIRDQIAKVTKALERQRIVGLNREDQDVITLFRKGQDVGITILFIRGGVVLGKKDFFLKEVGGDSDDVLLSTFIQQFYDKDRVIPKQVILPARLPDAALLQQWLSDKNKTPIHLVFPARGAYRSLLNLAMENAQAAFEMKATTKEIAEDSLIAVQKMLHLTRLPNRIEGFDISNIMGESAVGSMVVFEGGAPKKSDYRRFRIKTVSGADDFAMMAEVLTRRVQAFSEKEGALPDLILVDGGRGQLSAVGSVLKETPFSDIDLIGLAKEKNGNPERVYFPDRADPMVLPTGSLETKLLVAVRDEAHRFAITYHRKIRSQKMTISQLEEISGIGKKRRLLLLRHFGSVAKIKEAALEEISAVDGLPQKVAQQLFEAFHPDISLEDVSS